MTHQMLHSDARELLLMDEAQFRADERRKTLAMIAERMDLLIQVIPSHYSWERAFRQLRREIQP